jgi:hypothetical protein
MTHEDTVLPLLQCKSARFSDGPARRRMRRAEKGRADGATIHDDVKQDVDLMRLLQQLVVGVVHHGNASVVERWTGCALVSPRVRSGSSSSAGAPHTGISLVMVLEEVGHVGRAVDHVSHLEPSRGYKGLPRTRRVATAHDSPLQQVEVFGVLSRADPDALRWQQREAAAAAHGAVARRRLTD